MIMFLITVGASQGWGFSVKREMEQGIPFTHYYIGHEHSEITTQILTLHALKLNLSKIRKKA